MMFDQTHTLYIIVSLFFTVVVLQLAFKHLHRPAQKLSLLKLLALLTFFLHISPLWTTYLGNNHNYGYAYDNILFPIHFCNLAMYCLLVAAYLKPKTLGYQSFITFTAWAGIFGSLISLFYPIYYLNQPTLSDWIVLKSMLSHSTLLIGSLYLILGGFVTIERMNLRDYSVGLMGVLFIGLFNNGVLSHYGKNVNSMFLRQPPIEGFPILNYFTIALMMLLIMAFVIGIKEKVLRVTFQNSEGLKKTA